jgi:D-glycero-D-manno-heptose 1,7-bisphosphate phosphatase
LSERDALLVFSVGGGSREHNVSTNLVGAMEAAHGIGAAIYGVVGAPMGTLAELADVAVLIEAPPELRTPLVESFQAVVWHALVSHPELALAAGSLGVARRARSIVSGRPAAFLDRDGVLNELVPDPSSGQPESPLRADDVRLLPGVAAAANELARAGYALVCVSNQPAAAKGKVSVEQLHAVHARVLDLLGRDGVRLDASRLCLHHPDGSISELSGPCDCRKPAPGMLLDAAEALGLDLAASWMLGDTDTDVAAGRAAGAGPY